MQKILVACPIHESKEYSFQAWIDSVKKLDYPNIEYLVIDHSPTEDFVNRWKHKIPIKYIGSVEPANIGIATAMEEIRQYFLKSDAKYWLNLESDIIAPSETIRYFLSLGEYDWYEHHYPYRNRDWPPLLNGFGCTMFSQKLIRENSFKDCPETMTPDGYFWNQVVTRNLNFTSYKVIESYNVLKIKHLALEGVD